MFARLSRLGRIQPTLRRLAASIFTGTGWLKMCNSTDLHGLLKRATELQGRTMTDFVVAAVQDAAQRAVEQAEVVRLSMTDQPCFADALLDAPHDRSTFNSGTPALDRYFREQVSQDMRRSVLPSPRVHRTAGNTIDAVSAVGHGAHRAIASTPLAIFPLSSLDGVQAQHQRHRMLR